MKKTQRKDAVRNIKRKIVSWISVVIVTMMTVGVFLGCYCFNQVTREEAIRYYREHNFKDLEVISSTGVLPSELDMLRNVEGVRDAEGYHLIEATMEYGDKNVLKADLIRKTERISTPELIEGALPEQKGEIAVSRGLAKQKGIKIGDSVRILASSEQEKLLATNDFTVTGLVEHADYYLTRSTDFLMAADPSFDTETLNGGYLRAVIVCDLPEDTNIFKDSYYDQTAPVEDRIRSLFPSMIVSHENEMRSMLEEKFEEELAEPRKKLEDGRNELADGKKKLDDGKEKIDQGAEELAQKEQELADGKAKLEETEQKLIDSEKELNAGRTELEEKEAAGRKELAANKTKLTAAEKEVAEGTKKVNTVETTIKDIAKALGESDLPAEYYTLKKKAIEYYKPAMQAKIQNRSNDKLLADAEQKVNAAVDAEISSGSGKLEAFLQKASEEQKARYEKLIADLESAGKSLLYKLFNGLGQAGAAQIAISDAKKQLTAAERKAETELAEGKQKLADAEKQLEDGRAQYEEGKKQYEEGLKQFEDGKKKLEDSRKEYEEGLAEYEENRKKLEDGEEELSKKITEAEAQIEEKIDGSFVVQNRRTNTGYVTLRTNVHAIEMASGAFIILFLIVSSLVAFSTVVIIVDEQKALVGAMKSLGFFNAAIRSKYMMFGLSAAVVGCLTGLLLGTGVEDVFRYGIDPLYVSGRPEFSIKVIPYLIAVVLVLVVVTAAVTVACRSVLKYSAVQLMSGNTNTNAMKKETKNKKSGGLYGRLIMRNIRTEFPRVVITTLIVASSCLLIGVGFTLRAGFSGMVDKQVSDVWNYDVRISYADSISQEDKEKMEATLRESGTEFVFAMEQGLIYRTEKLQEYTYVLVMDQSIIPSFYHVKDIKTGKEMSLPEDGVLIQNRIQETQDLSVGDRIFLCDRKLKEHATTIAGVYENHYGRTTIMSRKGYEQLFGKEAQDNLYFIHLNGANKEELVSRLREIYPSLQVSSEADIQEEFSSMKRAYSTVVLMLTGLAILMSVFILANLTNIFISRRRKELIVMRVNGFSQKQCIGYLIRETLTTTIFGFIIAILIGGAIGAFLVRLIEPPEGMMDRSFQVMAWVYAVLLEGIFALCINTWVFRKVKDFKVTEINT
ncbi:MAG: FtsX-like permease family protein [Eubacterium sp.]|nr:FtsX-like permease family protein [Eubacterium sp.]